MSEQQTDSDYEARMEKLVGDLIVLTQSIQVDIAACLSQEKKIRENCERMIKKPDHIIVEELGLVVRNFILAMPLASRYGANLIMNIIQYHAKLMEDEEFLDICEQINKKIQRNNSN